MTTPQPPSDPASRVAVITGSTGMVGTALMPALERAGYTCRRLVRRTPRGPNESEWEPNRGTIDVAALEGAQVVVNLAGENIAQRWTGLRRQEIMNSRVRGTSLLVNTIGRLKRRPEVMISMSAAGIYGDRGDTVLDESSTHGTDFLASVAEAWEQAAAPAAGHGVRVVNPRMGVVIAGEGGAMDRLLPLFKLGLGGRIGSGDQWMSWIALGDVVRALLFIVGAPGLTGPLNLVAPNPVTNTGFTRSMGIVLRRPTMFPVPRAAIKLAFGEMGEQTILASQRMRPRVLMDAGFEFSLPTLEAALRAELLSS